MKKTQVKYPRMGTTVKGNDDKEDITKRKYNLLEIKTIEFYEVKHRKQRSQQKEF